MQRFLFSTKRHLPKISNLGLLILPVKFLNSIQRSIINPDGVLIRHEYPNSSVVPTMVNMEMLTVHFVRHEHLGA